MGKNKKSVAGNEQDKKGQKPKRSKNKNEEESRKGLPRRTMKSGTKNSAARHLERKPAKKLRRILRNNHPSEAFNWASRTGSIVTLSRISEESTSVGAAAKAALASKGKMWRRKLVRILRTHSSQDVVRLAGYFGASLLKIATEETEDGKAASAVVVFHYLQHGSPAEAYQSAEKYERLDLLQRISLGDSLTAHRARAALVSKGKGS